MARPRGLEPPEMRRGAGVVERGGLENRCGRKSTQGSNPCLSASSFPDVYPFHRFGFPRPTEADHLPPKRIPVNSRPKAHGRGTARHDLIRIMDPALIAIFKNSVRDRRNDLEVGAFIHKPITWIIVLHQVLFQHKIRNAFRLFHINKPFILRRIVLPRCR